MKKFPAQPFVGTICKVCPRRVRRGIISSASTRINEKWVKRNVLNLKINKQSKKGIRTWVRTDFLWTLNQLRYTALLLKFAKIYIWILHRTLKIKKKNYSMRIRTLDRWTRDPLQAGKHSGFGSGSTTRIIRKIPKIPQLFIFLKLKIR